jgi:hypothetical protein
MMGRSAGLEKNRGDGGLGDPLFEAASGKPMSLRDPSRLVGDRHFENTLRQIDCDHR